MGVRRALGITVFYGRLRGFNVRRDDTDEETDKAVPSLLQKEDENHEQPLRMGIGECALLLDLCTMETRSCPQKG